MMEDTMTLIQVNIGLSDPDPEILINQLYQI